ncbi:MAG TPA: hypothetical protein VF582_02685 [Allosphingosinicella sp.]|jgi:hypothetical protein
MPRQGPLDWISRFIMLALAGMVTLSVVGVIEAIPRGAMQDRIGIEPPRRQLPQQPQQEPEPAEPQPRQTEQPQPEPGTGGVPDGGVYGPAVAPEPAEDEDVERWLEAITYALMALVGLLGIATLMLWRSLKERRRIANALEALSSSQRT